MSLGIPVAHAQVDLPRSALGETYPTTVRWGETFYKGQVPTGHTDPWCGRREDISFPAGGAPLKPNATSAGSR